MGRWIARIAGGQGGRRGTSICVAWRSATGSFGETWAMQAAPLVIWFIVLLVVGREVSPFDRSFAGAYFLPHLFGVTAVTTCRFLAYGNDYKGVWSFGVVPDSTFGPFARGIYAALWLLLIVGPHVFWLVVLAWSWGVRDGVFFIVHSAAVASLYLGLGLRLIDGVPFGKQTPAAARSLTAGVLLSYPVVLGVVIGIQYVLFRSVAAVAVSTVVVGLGTYFVTGVGLARFASRIRSHLSPAAPGSMFRSMQDDGGL